MNKICIYKQTSIIKITLIFCSCLLWFPNIIRGKNICGDWILIKDSSTAVMYFSGCKLSITRGKTQLKTVWTWQSSSPHIDSLKLPLNKSVYTYKQKNRVWPYENFMGVNYDLLSKNEAKILSYSNVNLNIKDSYYVRTSQGKKKIDSQINYTLSPDSNFLIVNVMRPSRPFPARYVFRRDRHIQAYCYTVINNWKLNEHVADNVMLISLQGLVNRHKPQLYLLYPDNWEYRFTRPLKKFYENDLGYTFISLSSQNKVLEKFKKYIKGYIVWDTQSRASLCVAFTLAGLDDAIVISPEQKDMVEKMGLRMLKDFTGEFRGMSDYQVFHWAYKNYWKRCNKDFILWMGGEDNDQIMPGIADFGISKKMFFVDLSTDPKNRTEYVFADSLMSEMNPLGLVMGWHSYSKDLERNYVSLASKHGLRVEGLNTFPNLSFTSVTPVSPNFKFKNNHTQLSNMPPIDKHKVYIACVQTDGLGLGAWNEPGRGSLPYAWEVTINWAWMAPVLLEYYYKEATKNDYFFGSLSGPGYMYPKAIPDSLFTPLMHVTDSLCKKLDLNIFETMDYSEGSSGVGNNDLPKSIVEKYFKAMPTMMGMLNGYAPSYTFGLVDRKPFISYDYYLNEHLSEKDAVADLKELIRLNDKRPYFLALHVREWNNIDRVKRIIDQLGDEVEVVPLDYFMKMAAENWTFKDHYLKSNK